MSEEDKPAEAPAEEKKEEPAVEPAAPSNPVERAEAAVKAMEEANKKTEELLDRQEKARSRDILAGRADAGEQDPVKTKDEKKKEAAKEFFKGTQIEKAIEKHG